MNSTQLATLAPLVAVNLVAVLALMVIAFRRNETAVRVITLLGLGGALFAVLTAKTPLPDVGPLFAFDALGFFFLTLVLVAGLVVTLFVRNALRGLDEKPEELYVLLLLATAGAALVCVSVHFVSFYLGLEILTVSLYGMVGYHRRSTLGTEAALKYLVLAAVSAAFLLFGIALVYAEGGRLDFAVLGTVAGDSALVWIGLGLMLVGIGFKLSLVPFHGWAPDVYQAAPAPVAAFLSTASKAAALVVVCRWVAAASGGAIEALTTMLALLAIVSMVIGNVLALRQPDIRRLLAYSSTAHLGYALVPLVAAGAVGYRAAGAYLAAYLPTTLAAFGVLAILAVADPDRNPNSQLPGLFSRRPLLGALMVLALLSLAGMPLTAGFIGKFAVIRAGADGAAWLALVALVVGSALGAYYYLRMVALVLRPAAEPAPLPVVVAEIPFTVKLALVALAVGILGLGLYPEPLLRGIL